MLIIGGEQAPVERVALTEENENDVKAFYYAKNATAATVPPSGEVRVPDTIPWPQPEVVPEDARGWWVYDAHWDSRFVDIDYSTRQIKLKTVGKTEITFTIENADGTTIDLVWDLDILDKLTPLSVSIDPSYDTTMQISSLWQILAQVDGGDYPYTFRWFKDDIIVRERQTPQDTPLDKQDYLTFQSLAWKDEGVYRIEAYDRHGSLAKSTAIRLTITPDAIVFTNAEETYRVREGMPWSDTIDFTGGKPPFKYVWLRDGNATPYSSQTISIPAVTPADRGLYTLQITDALGTTETSVDGYHLYVIELMLSIAAATMDASAVTTQYSPDRIGVVLDLGGPAKDYSFQLSATHYVGGAAEQVGDIEVLNNDATAVQVVPSAGGKVKLVPKWTRDNTFKIRTKDGRSDPVTIEAKVISLPAFSAPLTAPLLLTRQDSTPQRRVITAPLYPAAGDAIEFYQWQVKRPGDADFVDLAVPSVNSVTASAPTGRVTSPTQYRIVVRNKYTGDKPLVSNAVAFPFANLHEYDLLRTQYPDDPLIPGGVYQWILSGAHNSGDPEPFNRGLNDPGTIITWTLPSATGVTLTKIDSDKAVQASVAMDAPAASAAQTVAINLKNYNGTPLVESSDSATFTVARPVLTQKSANAFLGMEYLIANLAVPPAFGRMQAIDISVQGGAGKVTTRVDKATGDVYATGVAKTTDEALTVVLKYKAPGNTALLSLSFPTTVSVSELIRFRAGEGTAGDPLTYYK